MQSTKPKPINYNKLKVAELTALLEGRGLPSAGTKLQMISRLVCQDAEELAAEKAAAKAIKEALPSAAEEPKDGGKGGGKVKKGKSVRARGGGARKSADKDGEVEESEDVGVSADNGIEDVDKTNEDDTDIPPVSDYILKQMMATLATKQKVSDAASADAVNPDGTFNGSFTSLFDLNFLSRVLPRESSMTADHHRHHRQHDSETPYCARNSSPPSPPPSRRPQSKEPRSLASIYYYCTQHRDWRRQRLTLNRENSRGSIFFPRPPGLTSQPRRQRRRCSRKFGAASYLESAARMCLLHCSWSGTCNGRCKVDSQGVGCR